MKKKKQDYVKYKRLSTQRMTSKEISRLIKTTNYNENLSSSKYKLSSNVRNRAATEPVTLKVHNIKLSFDIWLVLYIHFILYS